MEREPGDGSLFFRGLQSRGHKQVKLRQRKSALYLRPQRGGRRRGERGGGRRPGSSEGSTCRAGPRGRRAAAGTSALRPSPRENSGREGRPAPGPRPAVTGLRRARGRVPEWDEGGPAAALAPSAFCAVGMRCRQQQQHRASRGGGFL